MVSEEAKRRHNCSTRAACAFLGADTERVIAFVCECSDSDCRASVLLSGGGYATLGGAGELLMHDGHRPG